jgi:hypothetical protein
MHEKGWLNDLLVAGCWMWFRMKSHGEHGEHKIGSLVVGCWLLVFEKSHGAHGEHGGRRESWLKGLMVAEKLVNWFNGCWLLGVGYKGITV